MKTIWIINHYAIPPSLGGLNRHYYFAKNLIEKGYKVRIFTSSIIHNSDKDMLADCADKFKEIEVDGVTYTYVKSSPYKGNGLSRIKNMLGFAFDVRLIKKKFQEEKPDVIYTSSPDFFTAYAAENLAKKLRRPCVVEIRDLWPLSIVEYMGMSNRNPIIWALYQFEKKLYKRATNLVFTQEGGKQYIIDKGWDKKIDVQKVYHINNGIEYDKARANIDKYTVEDEQLNDGKLKLMYAGSIRKANGIEVLISAAKIIQDKYDDVEFLLYGEGDCRELCEKQCQDEGINNVFFKGRLPRDYMPFVLSKGWATYVVGRDVKVWQYGGSTNKLFDYLASGKPVFVNKMKFSIIDKYQSGISTTSDVEGVVEAITKLHEMPKERYNEICENALRAAKDYDYKVLSDKFENVILDAEKKYKG